MVEIDVYHKNRQTVMTISTRSATILDIERRTYLAKRILVFLLKRRDREIEIERIETLASQL